MKIQDIKECYQTTTIKDVNERLKKDFTLFKILSTSTRDGRTLPMYVLGK